MLIDVLLACAAVVAAGPAALAALTSHASVTSRTRLQKRLYGTLLLAEKLPPTAVGAGQIARAADRQTLDVAYAAQYPQRSREIVRIGLIGAGTLGAVIAYYYLLADDASLLALLLVLGVVAVAGLWFERAVVNFSRNDEVSRRLFAHFGAPEGLVRPHTELVAKALALSVETVFERAADVRDAQHGTMTTLDAVNEVLAKAHSHFDWRLQTRSAARGVAATDFRALASTTATHAATAYRWSHRHVVATGHRLAAVDHRTSARTVAAKSLAYTKTGYDWLLRHLLGPFFNLCLRFLGEREHRRIAKAQRDGDVYKAAWLSMHYRTERSQLAGHWGRLHTLRIPSLEQADTEPISVNGSAPSRDPATPLPTCA